MCWNNLRVSGAITSSGIVATTEPEFRDAYVRGTANYAPFVPNDRLSSGFVSLFTMHVTSQYGVEYDAEYLRHREFPTLPSRLSAVYAFGHEDDCQKAHELYQWDLSTLRRFRLVQHPLTRVHRANMEIVSLMRSVYPKASWSRDERDSIWRHYWTGGGAMDVEIPVVKEGAFTRQRITSGEIWEYLIEGQLQLVDEDA